MFLNVLLNTTSLILDEFHVLPNVTTLNISCNYFKEISNINILFPNVKNLNLSNNQLQELSIVVILC